MAQSAPPGSRTVRRTVVVFAVIYFVAMALFCTFPLLRVANTARPFVLGLPFVMMWFVAWVLGSMVVFWMLDRTEGQ